MFSTAIMRTNTLIAGALLAVSLMTRAQAIPCSPVDFGPAFGAPDGWTILTNQLAECGITFSTVDPKGVYWWGTGSEASFQYCITAGYLPAGGGPGCIDPIRVDFSSPVSFVSIRGYDGGGDADIMVLEAYGAGDILVDSQEITAIFDFPGETATVTGAIEYVTFRVEGTTAGLFFDDLEWEGIVSVSPTSWGAIKALYR